MNFNLTAIYKRYRTLQTHQISALPIVILMPHSACNCRCIMCDIWKDNKNLKQLTPEAVETLLTALKRFGTQEVVMSGGEALLNTNFFALCEILKREKIKITLLTTGLSIKQNAEKIIRHIDELIVSIDGDEALHDAIRNIPGAFAKLKEGVEFLHLLKPNLRITARTVIHRINFRNWLSIVNVAKEMGINQISFLPADVSSHAFNRQTAWSEPRQDEILPSQDDLIDLSDIINRLVNNNLHDFNSKFIAESPAKIKEIYAYYSAFYGLNAFPFKKCNAPWVSTVIEADGKVRPCFFHEPIGNIYDSNLAELLNSPKAVEFRKSLVMNENPTCIKCVCSLNLSPLTRIN
jgi:MoaA/NifB/PqqE/SkfB family radical SAM enzyme